MSRRVNTRPSRSATPNANQRVDGRTQFVRSLLDGMKHARMSTGGRPSAAKLGVAIGKDTRTARRILAGKQRLDFERLRDRAPKLWPHFFRCLVWHERKARVL